jgi:hypothetical protein
VLSPRSAVNVIVGFGKTEVIKKFKIKVTNGDWPEDEPGPHTIQLVVLDGSCPAGTVLGVDFDGATPGDQPSVSLQPFKSKGGTVLIRIERDSFTTVNRLAPARCMLDMRVVTTGVINEDPQPSNDRARLPINVFDKNDMEQATSHESVLRSAKLVKVIIPFEADAPKIKKATAKVVNADILPIPELAGHPVNLSVDDNDCPPGTVSVVTMLPATVEGGKNLSVKLQVSADAEDFETASKKSPARCTARITMTTDVPANSEPDSTNNTSDLVIDVYDKNDLL